MRRNIRLTESQLHSVIKESVYRILKETSDNLLYNAEHKANDDKFKLSMKKYTWDSWPNVSPSFSDKDEKLLQRRTRQDKFFQDEENRRRNNEIENATKEGKSLYFYLPRDSYGQPNGEIRRIFLTPEEYEERKENGEIIYDDGLKAQRRVND